jgi:hypothetical protein
MCSVCSTNSICTLSGTGVISCNCSLGYTGTLCDIRKFCFYLEFLKSYLIDFHLAVDLCAQANRSCLNGACVINSSTSIPYCNCSSPLFTGARCEV